MFSRDQVLALMRERVHHPAGMRELLQVLKIPRDERASFKRHIKALVESGLVRQWKDCEDRRRTLLELEDHTLAAMQSYIVAIAPV